MRTASPRTAARFPSAGCSRSKGREAGPPARPFSRCCFRLLRRDLRAKFAAMTATTLMRRDTISVSDFRCTARPDDAPFVERHCCHSISYVRKGSFGYHSRGHSSNSSRARCWSAIPATNMSARTITSAATSACRSSLGPELVEAIGGGGGIWRIGGRAAAAGTDGDRRIGAGRRRRPQRCRSR